MLGRLLALAGAGLLIGAAWWRKNPSACPYGQRFLIELPHPGITRTRLIEILEPRPGERVLEIGPGTGYYTFAMAERLEGGQVDLFDIQQEMLDHVMRHADRRGVTNLIATRGDAQALPYGDATFDAAVLITVLGEIPDQEKALREIHRVLKPGGRLIVGEMLVDPHVVMERKLRERGERAGLELTDRIGGPLGYFARLAKAPSAQSAATSQA